MLKIGRNESLALRELIEARADDELHSVTDYALKDSFQPCLPQSIFNRTVYDKCCFKTVIQSDSLVIENKKIMIQYHRNSLFVMLQFHLGSHSEIMESRLHLAMSRDFSNVSLFEQLSWRKMSTF